MKKVFLLLGIAGFSSLSAQQKDIFDINSYLKKKNADTIKLSYKNIPVSGFKKLVQLKPNNTLLNFNFLLSNGNKVYSSPAYNMPIVIPDMQSFTIMPNLKTVQDTNYISHNKKEAGKIPNGAPSITKKSR